MRNPFAGLPTAVVTGTTADTALSPEREREIEGGVDVTLLGGRMQLGASVYQKSVKDLLLRRSLDICVCATILGRGKHVAFR